jgi:hypothetical protein
MMKALEIAIEKLKALPEERRAYAAEVVEQIAGSGISRAPAPRRGNITENLRLMCVAVPRRGRPRSQGARCSGSASAERLALDGAPSARATLRRRT